MIIKVQKYYQDYIRERNTKDLSVGDTYKIFENVTNEFGTEKYFVSSDSPSPTNIVGKFNDLTDAEMFCTLKNLVKDY